MTKTDTCEKIAKAGHIWHTIFSASGLGQEKVTLVLYSDGKEIQGCIRITNPDGVTFQTPLQKMEWEFIAPYADKLRTQGELALEGLSRLYEGSGSDDLPPRGDENA